MSEGTVHVVGAGVAGLAAAMELVRTGRQVRLYEAAARAGGRCAAVRDGHDNGTHVLLGANRRALAFLTAIGARADWIEPEPEGLPVVDLARGTVLRTGLSLASWLRRPPPGLTGDAFVRLLRLSLSPHDRPVEEVAGKGAFARAILEPLTLAALNTPTAEASSRRLALVVRRALLPGGGRLLVARRGLGPDLVEPTLAALAAQGVHPRYRMPLQGLEQRFGSVRRLRFASDEVPLGDRDRVILALPPYAASRLLPQPGLPDRYEPIVNIHFTLAYDGPVRFVGLLGGLGHWALFRPGSASVTISAAREAVLLPVEELFARTRVELTSAGPLVGLPTSSLEPLRVIKERRATLSQPAGFKLTCDRAPFGNLVLAGDWLSSLPATIEAAVGSGQDAARSILSGGLPTPIADVRRPAPAD